ncbi:MAG: response regulator [Gemmatimonadales bacterium]|nr:response regulator [Gemmatimonadales bacterium]
MADTSHLAGRLTEARRAEDTSPGGPAERALAALHAADMGTWHWDPGTGEQILSERCRELLGLPSDAVASQEQLLAAVHPDDRQRVTEAARRTTEYDEVYDVECRVVWPDETLHWIAFRGCGMRNRAGVVIRVEGVAYEVTRRREMESHLLHAQRLEAIGRLAGGVSHEFNNQLTVVGAFTDFILKSPDLPANLREDVLEIQRAADRASGIARQLLAYSRQQVLKPELLDLNVLLRETRDLLQRVIGADVAIQLELGTGLGAVRADHDQLIQVLINLALNARDAMPRGGRLLLSTRSAPMDPGNRLPGQTVVIPAGRYTELVIEDTGRGIPAGVLPHIFEPFFTTKDVGRGTGLGLSTVYGIVKQSGGFLWAVSDPERGSRFTILLPEVAVPAGEIPLAKQPPHPQAPTAHRTVLVVEDEEAVRQVVVRMLAEKDYRVLEARDGQEALDRLSREAWPVHLVLTDLVMPVMNGNDLTTELRERYPDLPVVAMSGHPSEEMIRRGLLEVGGPFLNKPFSADQLLLLVGAHLASPTSAPPEL